MLYSGCSRGLEAALPEAEAKTHEAEAKTHEAEARVFGLEAEARPRGLTSLLRIRDSSCVRRYVLLCFIMFFISYYRA